MNPDSRWLCFKDAYPANHKRGHLLKIDGDYWDGTDLRDLVFFGYFWPECKYVYIVYEVTRNAGYAWKATKDFDLDQIYWYRQTNYEGSVEEVIYNDKSSLLLNTSQTT